jgi:hypothetical protein
MVPWSVLAIWGRYAGEVRRDDLRADAVNETGERFHHPDRTGSF